MIRTLDELREYLEIAPKPHSDDDPRVKVEVYRAVTFRCIHILANHIEALEEKVKQLEDTRHESTGIYSGSGR